MALLAHCVSLTANAIRVPGREAGESDAHADILAREVALDMTGYWQPTAASYFERVSKERILQAVRLPPMATRIMASETSMRVS